MNKKLLFLLITICIFSLPACTLKNKSNTEADNLTSSQIYIVKEYEGKVAVFQYGSNSPVRILDCTIKYLPPDAAEALATGIEVNSIEELQKIIEAYD